MSTDHALLKPTTMGQRNLQNHIVMAPMTRCRATADHVPTDIMAKYYGDRAAAGLIVTEGIGPSPNGIGYARIPGLYTDDQVAGWKPVTQAVHDNGGVIFAQLMHTGRVSHPANMPEGARVLAPSALALQQQKMWVDGEGELPTPEPEVMTTADILQAQDEYVNAAKNAIAAGFDGVELHAANGYLMEQFFNPISNLRTDEYGGNPENRARFILETTEKVIAAIGAENVGIRLSPGGVFGELGPFEGMTEAFASLAAELDKLGVVYIHLVNHGSFGVPPLPDDAREAIRNAFSGTLIVCGGYDAASALDDLETKTDLIAIGRPFIANPDLVERVKQGAAWNSPNMETFYTPGEVGYTDYTPLAVQA